MDLKNHIYREAITLQPYSSIVLMAAEPIVKKSASNLMANVQDSGLGINQYKETDFELKAYPNPFHSKLSLEFTMPTAGNGILMLYDIQARMISEIHKG